MAWSIYMYYWSAFAWNFTSKYHSIIYNVANVVFSVNSHSLWFDPKMWTEPKNAKIVTLTWTQFSPISWRDTELHKSNCFYVPMETYFILIFFSAKDCHFFYSGNKHFIIKVWILILITLKMRSRLGQYVVTGTTLGSPDTSSTGSVDLLVLWDGIWSWMSLLDTLLRSSVKLSCLKP